VIATLEDSGFAPNTVFTVEIAEHVSMGDFFITPWHDILARIS
jgi:hypothetical protein